MRNTKLFKTFISFFDRSKTVSALTITKKRYNFLSIFPKKLSFNDKFKFVYTFIKKLTGFNFYKDIYEKPKQKFKVSGLFCPSPKERLFLNNKTTDLTLKKTLILHLMDYFFKIYGKQEIKSFDDLFNLIGNLLTYSNLTISPYSYPNKHKHNFYAYFTFKQHLLASNFAEFNIPIKFLINYYKNYLKFDIEEYLNAKNVPITLILEFHMVFLAFRKFFEIDPNFFILAANPDNPFYGEFRSFIYSILGQPNGDIIIFIIQEILCKQTGHTESIITKIIPMDIKLKAQPELPLGLFKGHLSIMPSFDLQDQNQFFKRFLADLKGTARQKLKNKIISQMEKKLCDSWAKKIESIIKSNATFIEKQKNFDHWYNFYLLNPNLKNIIPSKILIAIEDFEFSSYYKIHYKSINNLINKLYHKIDERLFDGQYVDPEYIKDLFVEILQHWKEFDPVMGQKLLDHFLGVKKLFILHDFIS